MTRLYDPELAAKVTKSGQEAIKSMTASIKVWVIRGQMMVNTSALEWHDPDHPYNQIKSQGLIPEYYGYSHPLHERFKDNSRGDLIDMIVDLETQLVGYMREFG